MSARMSIAHRSSPAPPCGSPAVASRSPRASSRTAATDRGRAPTAASSVEHRLQQGSAWCSVRRRPTPPGRGCRRRAPAGRGGRRRSPPRPPAAWRSPRRPAPPGTAAWPEARQRDAVPARVRCAGDRPLRRLLGTAHVADAEEAVQEVDPEPEREPARVDRPSGRRCARRRASRRLVELVRQARPDRPDERQLRVALAAVRPRQRRQPAPDVRAARARPTSAGPGRRPGVRRRARRAPRSRGRSPPRRHRPPRATRRPARAAPARASARPGQLDPQRLREQLVRVVPLAPRCPPR